MEKGVNLFLSGFIFASILISILTVFLAGSVTASISLGGSGGTSTDFSGIKVGDVATWKDVKEDKREPGANLDLPIPPSSFSKVAEYLQEGKTASKEQLEQYVKDKNGAAGVSLNGQGIVVDPGTGAVKSPTSPGSVVVNPGAQKGNDVAIGSDFTNSGGSTGGASVTTPGGQSVNTNTGIIDGIPPGVQPPGITPPGTTPPGTTPPGIQPPDSGIGGGDDIGVGGGGGGGSGGGGDPGQELLSALQGAFTMVSQIAGSLKGAAGGEGSSQVSQNGNNVIVGLEAGAEFSMGEEIASCRKMCEAQCDEEDNCDEKCTELCDIRIAGLAQEEASGEKSETVFKDAKLDEFTSTDNTKVTIPGQIVAHVHEGTPDTTFYDKGISGDYYADLSSSVTGAAISKVDDQYIKLNGHSMEVSGEKLSIDLLKTFNEIKGNGKGLLIVNGKMELEFDKEKVMYSRRIRDVNHAIYRVRNSLDKDNYFMLENYEGRNLLADGRRAITIGTKTADNPNYEGFIVSDLRKEMYN